MSRSRRLILGASIVAALIASATATGARPDITRVSFEDSYVDTQTCPGMALDTQLEAHVTVQFFSATRAQVHQRFTYSVAANGKTFTDNESFTEFANPASGVSRFAGTQINIQVPGYGNLLADRGTITIDFSTDPWTVLFEAGPHPFFHGGYGALCAYLASQ
jgi:hypothetical protein